MARSQEFDYANHIIGLHAGVETDFDTDQPRVNRSMIFHALPQRGAAITLQVFEELNWTDASLSFFSYEHQSNADTKYLSDWMHTHAEASTSAPNVIIRGSASKADLFDILKSTDYFLYPVTSIDGLFI